MGLSSLPQLLLGSKGRADIHEEEVASGEGGDSHKGTGANKDSSSQQQQLLVVQQRQLQREQLRFRACLGVFR